MIARDLDVVTVQRRLELIRSLIEDLRSVGEVSRARLEQDRLLRHAIERILTQLVDLAVSANSHLASALSGRAPEDYRSSFDALAENGVTSEELAGRLAPSVGMRDILTHEYVAIDLAVVARSASAAVIDFGDYCAEVARWLAGFDVEPEGSTLGTGSDAAVRPFSAPDEPLPDPAADPCSPT